MNLWSHPKYEPNIARISALHCATLQDRNPYNFLVHILVETMTSKIYSEIYWPLVGSFLMDYFYDSEPAGHYLGGIKS